MIKIGINGFGRIGRLILRALLENYKELVTLIEWPEKIKKKIDNKIDLFFKYGEDMNKRFLSIKGLSSKKLNEIS